MTHLHEKEAAQMQVEPLSILRESDPPALKLVDVREVAVVVRIVGRLFVLDQLDRLIDDVTEGNAHSPCSSGSPISVILASLIPRRGFRYHRQTD
jgi:hypothetical protein